MPNRSLHVEIRLHAILLTIVLILFVGLSFHSSNDSWTYQSIYDHVYLLNHFLANYFPPDPNLHGEPLFIFLISFFRTLRVPYALFLLFFTGSSILIRFKFYKKYTPYVILALLIYFSHEYLSKEFTQMRAGLATSMLLFAIAPIRDRNFKKFLLVVILAGLIQSSALMAFPLYFLRIKKYSNSFLIIILGLAIISTQIDWSKHLMNLLHTHGYLPEGIYVYLGWKLYNFKLGLFNPVTVVRIFIVLLCIRYRDSLRNIIEDFDLLFLFYYFATIFILVFNGIAIIGARVSSIFMGVEPLLLISIARIVRPKYTGYLLIAFYSIIFLALDLFVKHSVLSYHTIFGL